MARSSGRQATVKVPEVQTITPQFAIEKATMVELQIV